jgi:hypothetical protein
MKSLLIAFVTLALNVFVNSQGNYQQQFAANQKLNCEKTENSNEKILS